MDPALIALPATALLSGGLIGFLVASIAFDRDARGKPRATFDLPVTGSDDEGWTEPPRMVLAPQSVMQLDKPLSKERAERLCQKFERLRESLRQGEHIARIYPEPPAASLVLAEHAELAASAIRRTAQALAELTRFVQEGPADDRFPLDEDVELFLAKALQDTINILLAFQPTAHERGELAQLEAAIHKFVTDYGA